MCVAVVSLKPTSVTEPQLVSQAETQELRSKLLQQQQHAELLRLRLSKLEDVSRAEAECQTDPLPVVPAAAPKKRRKPAVAATSTSTDACVG